MLLVGMKGVGCGGSVHLCTDLLTQLIEHIRRLNPRTIQSLSSMATPSVDIPNINTYLLPDKSGHCLHAHPDPRLPVLVTAQRSQTH